MLLTSAHSARTFTLVNHLIALLFLYTRRTIRLAFLYFSGRL